MKKKPLLALCLLGASLFLSVGVLKNIPYLSNNPTIVLAEDDEDIDVEEFKEAAIQEISNYVDSRDYYDEDFEAIDEIIRYGIEEIQAAGEVSEVREIVAFVKHRIDGVPTREERDHGDPGEPGKNINAEKEKAKVEIDFYINGFWCYEFFREEIDEIRDFWKEKIDAADTIEEVWESYDNFVSELDKYPSEYENYVNEMRYQYSNMFDNFLGDYLGMYGKTSSAQDNVIDGIVVTFKDELRNAEDIQAMEDAYQNAVNAVYQTLPLPQYSVPPFNNSDDNNNDNAGLIVACSIEGGVILLGVIAAAIFFLKKKRA